MHYFAEMFRCTFSFDWLIGISGPHLGRQEELRGLLQHAGHWLRLVSGRLEDSQKSLGTDCIFCNVTKRVQEAGSQLQKHVV